MFVVRIFKDIFNGPLLYDLSVGSNPLHGRHRDFFVSNALCFDSFFDGFNDLAEYLVCDHEFDFEFFDNVHYAFLPPIKLLVSILDPKLIDLVYRYSPDPDLSQSILYFS